MLIHTCVVKFAKIHGTSLRDRTEACPRVQIARDVEFRVNDLVAMSNDKSDRRSSSGNGKVACHDAITVTRHVARIDAKTRSGLRFGRSLGVHLYFVSSRFYSPS